MDGNFIDQLIFDNTVCYDHDDWISTQSQRVKHIVMEGRIKQVATVSSLALLCYEM